MFKKKKRDATDLLQVGSITMIAQVGRFRCSASNVVYGNAEIIGDTLENMRYDVDYHGAHAALVEAIENLAKFVKHDDDFKEMMFSD